VAVYTAGCDSQGLLSGFADTVVKKVPEAVDGVRTDPSGVTDNDVVGVLKEAEQVVVRVHTGMERRKKDLVRIVLKDCVPVEYTPSLNFKGNLYPIV